MQIVMPVLTILLGLSFAGGQARALEYVVDCGALRNDMRQAAYDLVQAERMGGPDAERIRRHLIGLQMTADKYCTGGQAGQPRPIPSTLPPIPEPGEPAPIPTAQPSPRPVPIPSAGPKPPPPAAPIPASPTPPVLLVPATDPTACPPNTGDLACVNSDGTTVSGVCHPRSRAAGVGAALCQAMGGTQCNCTWNGQPITTHTAAQPTPPPPHQTVAPSGLPAMVVPPTARPMPPRTASLPARTSPVVVVRPPPRVASPGVHVRHPRVTTVKHRRPTGQVAIVPAKHKQKPRVANRPAPH